MRLLSLALGAAFAAGLAGSAAATPVVIGFGGLNGAAGEAPGGYYAGGQGGLGSGPGPNYGVTFSSDAVVVCSLGFACDDPEREGPSDVLRFLDPRAALTADPDPDAPSVMNVAGGFTGQLSLLYANAAESSTLRIWSGVGGTGSLLASLNLGSTCTAAACDFRQISQGFGGVAHSVEFVNFDFRLAGVDDIALTLADGGTGAVPEPSAWALAILGFGLAGARLRRRPALCRVR